jgi:hypothetical protein
MKVIYEFLLVMDGFSVSGVVLHRGFKVGHPEKLRFTLPLFMKFPEI